MARLLSSTVFITPEQDAVLRALSQRTGVTVAAYIREGIALVLARYADDALEALQAARAQRGAR